ncbi:MAG: hypothetical protein B0A82_01130 [Alkalinema sp. CACIAM 70d]|nr:MAG: hypothetical protein B0A82_01130 [Alkalinema sp. CACIAM 70d]
MHFLNKTSLIFYASAITLVVTLFMIVTRYGEANLKAEKKIAGKYTIATSSSKTLNGQVLELDQSGIYLNGGLYAATIAQDDRQMPKVYSLSGSKQGALWVLSGTTSAAACASTDSAPEFTRQQGQIATTLTLTIEAAPSPTIVQGQLTCPTPTPSVSFTAQKQPEIAKGEVSGKGH